MEDNEKRTVLRVGAFALLAIGLWWITPGGAPPGGGHARRGTRAAGDDATSAQPSAHSPAHELGPRAGADEIMTEAVALVDVAGADAGSLRQQLQARAVAVDAERRARIRREQRLRGREDDLSEDEALEIDAERRALLQRETMSDLRARFAAGSPDERATATMRSAIDALIGGGGVEPPVAAASERRRRWLPSQRRSCPRAPSRRGALPHGSRHHPPCRRSACPAAVRHSSRARPMLRSRRRWDRAARSR